MICDFAPVLSAGIFLDESLGSIAVIVVQTIAIATAATAIVAAVQPIFSIVYSAICLILSWSCFACIGLLPMFTAQQVHMPLTDWTATVMTTPTATIPTC